jgi:hypothetical protein
MSNLLTNNLFDVMNEVQDLQRVETPGACLTLTRSATLAITTAGTTITWQTETRANGITWATTDITIPTSGYYAINFTYLANLSHTAYCRLQVNGNGVGLFTDSSIAANTHNFFVIRYFTADDVVRIQPVPSVNVTISVVAEGSPTESPILHVVQMTGSLT